MRRAAILIVLLAAVALLALRVRDVVRPGGPKPFMQPALLSQRLGEVRFDQEPFDAVLNELTRRTGVRIDVDWDLLWQSGIQRDAPVTARLRDVRLSKALAMILSDVGGGAVHLSWYGDGDRIRITTGGVAGRATLVVKAYDLTAELTVPSGSRLTRAERELELANLVKETVDRDSWIDNGGNTGRLQFQGNRLWVLQTEENHRQVDATATITITSSANLQTEENHRQVDALLAKLKAWAAPLSRPPERGLRVKLPGAKDGQ